MKDFITLTNKAQGMKQLININAIESLTNLNDGTLIHFVSGSKVTVTQNIDYIENLILNNK